MARASAAAQAVAARAGTNVVAGPEDANLPPRLPGETDQAYAVRLARQRAAMNARRAVTGQGPAGPVLQRMVGLPNGRPLPALDGIQTRFDPTSVQGRRILLCFWDMDQRPSRNLLDQLTGQSDALRRNRIEVLAIQVPGADPAKLDAWLREHQVPFHTGQASESEDRLLARWGVQARPWMILADPNHIIAAQGFNLEQLRTCLDSGDFTALPSQGPLVAVRAQRTIPQVQNPNWQEAFHKLYRLEEGQVLKRIAPPFIPERMDYLVSERSDAHAPDRMVFHWDGELKRWGKSFGDTGSVGSTLSFPLLMKRFEYEGPEDLLAVALPGDWIVRPESPIEDRLKALEEILATDLGRSIRFKRETAERPVVVATGRFDPRPLQEETGDTDIHLFSDDMTGEGVGGGTAHSIRDFLWSVGDLAGMPFVDETEPSELSQVPYRSHRSSYLRSLPSEQERQAKLQLLLDNISRQTNLHFEFTRRPVDVWFVTEEESSELGKGERP